VLLSVLAFLFLLRVLGQALVFFAGVTALPPMSEWYSGLLPYPLLLPTQVAIVGLQAWISLAFCAGTACSSGRGGESASSSPR
jgi:hypothetical protein